MPGNKIDRLPLEWIRVFEAAGRAGSFTAAAQEIGLTQAAVSQRIKNLEQILGVSLFSRKARGVTLTIDGEAWLPYVTQSLQTLARSAEDLFGNAPGRIVMSASASVTQMWIVPRLAAVQDRLDYHVSMTTMTIEPDFAKANATVEIRYSREDRMEPRSARLYREALSPLAAPTLMRSGEPWRNLPRIAVSGPRPGWQEWAQQTGDAAGSVPKYRFDNYVSAHFAARQGLGVVLGSLPLASSDLADGSLLRLSEHSLTPNAGYWMVANEHTLPHRQWEGLVRILCEPAVQ